MKKAMAELEENYNKAKEAAKNARHDVGEVKGQMRRFKNENETLSKKWKEQEEHVASLEKELKHVKGQLDQVHQIKGFARAGRLTILCNIRRNSRSERRTTSQGKPRVIEMHM